MGKHDIHGNISRKSSEIGQHIFRGLSTIGLCATSIIISQFIITIIEQIHWPAYNTSHVLLAVTTASSWIIFLTLTALQYIYRNHSEHLPGLKKLLKKYLIFINVSGLTALISTLLALPLGATRLYLGGISIDQQFRTEFLTRLTYSWHLSDMTYAQLPSYYPSGWFWLAGRYAAVMHIPGWAALKPVSIITLAIAATISYLWWEILLKKENNAAPKTGTLPYALLFSLASTLICLPFGQEPYSTALAIIFPAAVTSLWHALIPTINPDLSPNSPINATAHGSHKTDVISSGVFLGACMSGYTLYAGVFIFIMIFFALAVILLSPYKEPIAPTTNRRKNRYLIINSSYIIIIGLIIGAIVWLPFCHAIVHDFGALFAPGGASAYLPESGAILSLPFIELSIPGLLSLAGLLWLIRYLKYQQATIWVTTLLALYLWQIFSCLLTIFGTTLLSFRLTPLIDAILICAGICAIPWVYRLLHDHIGSQRLIAAITCLAIVCWLQAIPRSLGTDLNRAYTDTDGNGDRADKRPAGPERFYPQMAELIRKNSRIDADKIIIATSEYGFLAVSPFRGFQSLTPHYANPLAHFSQRNQLIISWSKAQNSAELWEDLHRAGHTIAVPQVWIFRSDSSPNYHIRLAENVFPNDPNVHRIPVDFAPTLFPENLWKTDKIGPFVIIISHSIVQQ